MDYYTQFLQEKKSGKYARCRYPNLIEIYVGMPTDYFAEVTQELMLAVFRGEEDLTFAEISRIAHYNKIPLSVLTCPEVIMLDMRRRRHRKMIAEVDNLYIQLKFMARDGNKEAESYLKFADWKQQCFMRAAHINKLSYGHYLTAREALSNYVKWSMPKLVKRELRTMKGGVASCG